jgi:hypothetical protein
MAVSLPYDADAEQATEGRSTVATMVMPPIDLYEESADTLDQQDAHAAAPQAPRTAPPENGELDRSTLAFFRGRLDEVLGW